MELFDRNQEELDALADEFEDRFEEVFITLALLASTEILIIQKITEWDAAWSKILKKAGFYEVLSDYSKRVDTLDASVVNLLTETATKGGLSSENKRDLTLLKKLHIKDLEKIGVDAGLRLKKHLHQYLIQDISRQDIVKLLAKDIENKQYKKYAKTYIVTAINDYRQALLDFRAESFTNAVWVYDGADIDGKTREYCQCVINQGGYYTHSDKLVIQNNPKRRYNCRHALYPMSEDRAKAEGLVFKGVVCQ